MKDSIPVTLRMPVDLHAWVKKQAEADRRSNHSFLLRLIEKAKEASNVRN